MSESSIEAIVAKYSNTRMATMADSDAILEFNRHVWMESGPFDIRFDRGAGFFDFYKQSPGQHWTILFLNSDKSIVGTATLIKSNRRIAGKLEPVAYLLDLRVSPTAELETKKQWRDGFKELVQSLPTMADAQKSKYSITAIFSDNAKAINALVKRAKGPVYSPLYTYWNIQILGRFLSFSTRGSEFTISESSEAYPDTAIDLLSKFDFTWSADDYRKLSRNLKSDKPSLLAKDTSGKVIGFCRPWSSGSARQLVMRFRTKFFHLLGVLIGVKNNQPVPILYETSLCIDPSLPKVMKQRVARALVNKSMRIFGKHPLTIITCADKDVVDAFKSPNYFSVIQGCSLYQVHTEGQELIPLDRSVVFEGAIS